LKLVLVFFGFHLVVRLATRYRNATKYKHPFLALFFFSSFFLLPCFVVPSNTCPRRRCIV
jgi:hypothetical protein